MTGATYAPVKAPQRIGETYFHKNSKTAIKKAVSGAHHTLVLTQDGKIFGWGDAEGG